MKVRSPLVCLFLLAAATAAVDWNAEGKRWWAHVQYLADDKLEGRETGSEGHRKAAVYVQDRFREYSLTPAGTAGYLQPVRLDVRQIDEEHSSVELFENSKYVPLKLGEDLSVGLRTNPPATLEAPAVFVGYGLSIPEAHYDDLAGLDLRGKIAVHLTGGPSSIPGPLRAHYSSASERWKVLERAGAAGLVVIQNPRSMDIPWSRASLARFQPSMDLADRDLKEAPDQKLSLALNPDRADRWIRSSGDHRLRELLALADAGKPLPRFNLGVKLRAKIAVKRWQVESQNVVGVLPGSDAQLKKEYVALSAHLDHLGVGMPINGDKIYNGAMDNASGVASLLETARGLKEAGAPPKRSILFVVVTAEEKGLLGSRYFVAHPTVARSIVADINIDMFLPLYALRYLEVQGLNESTLGDDVRAVAEGAGVQVQADREPNRNLFIRSDQYRFIRAGIPAVAFKFGSAPGSPEEKAAKNWLTKNYHAPSDDANQPVDLEGAAQFNHIILQLTERVADAAARPQWREDSFFRRFMRGE